MNPIVKDIAREAVSQGGAKRHAQGAAHKSPKNRARYYLNLFAEVAGPRVDTLTVQEILAGAILIDTLAREAA